MPHRGSNVAACADRPTRRGRDRAFRAGRRTCPSRRSNLPPVVRLYVPILDRRVSADPVISIRRWRVLGTAADEIAGRTEDAVVDPTPIGRAVLDRCPRGPGDARSVGARLAQRALPCGEGKPLEMRTVAEAR